jgi:hypothetical protein
MVDVSNIFYPTLNPDKGRFLILSVKAGLGRQGGKVDKEDFLRTMVFLLPR